MEWVNLKERPVERRLHTMLILQQQNALQQVLENFIHNGNPSVVVFSYQFNLTSSSNSIVYINEN
jgi:hypothetical protein